MPSFYQRFIETAGRFSGNVAVELQSASGSSRSGERYTYGELRESAERLGSWLQSSGIGSGSRCAILAANGPRWVAAYLGIMSAGCVAVPLDTAFKAEQVAKLLNDSGSSLLFSDVAHLEVAQEALHSAALNTATAIKLVSLNKTDPQSSQSPLSPQSPTLDDLVSAHAAAPKLPDTHDDDTAVLLYTSGTTADPKGVMLTHGNLHAEADSVFQMLRVTETDALLGVLPLFHALAQMANLLLPLSIGARVVFLETLNTADLLRALEERGITIFACVPQFFYLIHERIMKQIEDRGRGARLAFRVMLVLSRMAQTIGINLGRLFFVQAHRRLGPRMRFLITGGSRFDPAIGRDLRDMGFNILQAFGLTETSGAATLTPLGENVIGSVGKPLPRVEIRIAPAENSGEQGAGEILIRGPVVMKGYYNRPDATAEVLKDGWLHTGDLGHVDARGNLYITGRSKDVIVLSSGKNIHPEEIEAHYLHSPFIREICVMGLENRPGDPVSERLHAVIVPNFDVLRERKVVNAREVIRFDVEGLSAKLPSTKRILSYDIWQDELPRTTTRKLKRFEIRRRVQQRSRDSQQEQSLSAQRTFSETDRLWLANTDVQRALGVIREASKKKEEIHPDDNLELDLGLDSMERVELVVALQGTLGANVEDSEFANVYSVRELVEVLLKHLDSGKNSGAGGGWQAIFDSETDIPEVRETLAASPISTVFWFVAARVARWCAQMVYRIHVAGLEKVPQDRPFILTPNHQSFMDAPMLMSYFPFRVFRKMFYVGTSELFGAGIRRRIATTMKLVPVDPDAHLVPAMKAGAYGLRRGDALVLYPEGERSIDGEPKAFKKGAAILATHLQVPIVPVAVDGFEKAWGRGRGIKLFQNLQIRIGDPIEPPPASSASEKAYSKLTADLRDAVMQMWRSLRGEHSPEPELASTRE